MRHFIAGLYNETVEALFSALVLAGGYLAVCFVLVDVLKAR
ncbi:hypothetical protein [Desulfotomaculum copahuensis]|nr:hypothetical protein [Desulfotomaculum copahuensis]